MQYMELLKLAIGKVAKCNSRTLKFLTTVDHIFLATYSKLNFPYLTITLMITVLMQV